MNPWTLLRNLWTLLVSHTEGNYHLYAYAKNRTLLGMPVEALRLEGGRLRYRYVQVDSQNRCVPTDWYVIGYDIFAMHTFLRLTRTGSGEGYLRSYLDS